MDNNIWLPNKDRLIATLRGEIPDRVSWTEMLIEPKNVERIVGKDVGSTMAASRGAGEGDILVPPPMAPEYYFKILEYTCQDTVVLESLWAPFQVKEMDSIYAVQKGGVVKCWDDLDKVIAPNQDDITPRIQYVKEYVKAAKEKNIGVTYTTGAFFQYCYEYLIGFDNFCIMVLEDPELLEHCLDLVLKYYLDITDRVIEEGVDVLFFADDVAYRSGTFINPQMFKDMWLGRMQKLTQKAKDAGIPVMFHSCGNVTPIIDSVICNMGTDCLHPIEPYSMDIYAIKEKYSDRFCVAGNLDIAGPFAFGTPEEAYMEAAQMIEKLKKGGKYIFATSHSVTDDIPFENLNAVIKALKDTGKY